VTEPPDVHEQVWFAVDDALPARWRVGPPSFDPGRGHWRVTARGPHPGRGKVPTTVSGTGEDEIAALRDLDARLRQAFVSGAEEQSRAALGRGLTTDEMSSVLGHYRRP